MNICWFIDFFLPHYRGGGQVRLYEIGKRLVKKGHMLTVVTMRQKGAEQPEIIDGIEVWHIGPVVNNPPQRSLLDFLRFFFAIRTWLKTHSHDVVCAEGMSIIPAYLYSPAPVIATVHDVSAGGKDQWIRHGLLSRIGEWLTLHLPCRKIITVSNAMRQAIIDKGVKAEKVVTVYNAVDGEALANIPAINIPKNTIIFIGRFVPHKHVNDLIAAFALVIKKIPNAKLLLIGSGPEEKELKHLTQDYNLKRQVTFETSAESNTAIGMLKSAEVLALPSTREGFGIVLAEAGAVGVPVIAYDIPAVREVVIDKKTGLLVEHTPQALSTAIVDILQHPKKARIMGTTAIKYINEKFSWDYSAKELIDILENV